MTEAPRGLGRAARRATVAALVGLLAAGTLARAAGSGDLLRGPAHTEAAARPAPPADPLLALPVTLLGEGDPLPGAVLPGDRVSFRLRVRGVVVPYAVMGITALPGETLELVVERAGPDPDRFRLRTASATVEPTRPGAWRWSAPSAPGPRPLRVEDPASGEAVHLNVFVLHPHGSIREGRLNGFRIGPYRSRNAPPRGFIEATPDALRLRVAPDFVLRQFMPKQPGDPPYMTVTEPLVLKLQALLEEVRAEGIPARTLATLSGFRTPYYNRAIGNTTESSRHLWGDAADVFVDLNGNGRMDDLNGDGRANVDDARYLAALVDRIEARREPHVRPGGVGIYRANAVRGPFVHVDARGQRARW